MHQIHREDSKICVVPRSDEFECQGQWSRSPGQKTRCVLPPPPGSERMALSAARRTVMRSLQTTLNLLDYNVVMTFSFNNNNNNVMKQQMKPFCRCCRGVISAACVWFIFGKTSLALVFCCFSIGNYYHFPVQYLS